MFPCNESELVSTQFNYRILNSLTNESRINYVSSLYNFGANQIQITVSPTVPLLFCAYLLLRKRVLIA
jgi:hypothetical protein